MSSAASDTAMSAATGIHDIGEDIECEPYSHLDLESTIITPPNLGCRLRANTSSHAGGLLPDSDNLRVFTMRTDGDWDIGKGVRRVTRVPVRFLVFSA